MGETELTKIYYRAGYKYQLDTGYNIMLDVAPEKSMATEYISFLPNGLLTIHAGYAWDGPSGPTFDSRSAMRASLVHDALYQLIRREKLPHEFRELADKVFFGLCLEDGMFYARAWLWHRTLRLAGGPAAYGQDPKVQEAP